MSSNTKIEWATHTFNPWEGCQKVGAGCDKCYAEARNARFSGGKAPNWGPGAPRRRTSEANWRLPLKWNREAASSGIRPRVFCASLADVFDNAVPVQWRFDLMKLIEQTPNLDWLLLTKRIGNATAMLEQAVRAINHGRWGWSDNVFPNVWIGATIVTQEEANRDIPKLLETPAHVRFLSTEPLLGPVDLTRLRNPDPTRASTAFIDSLRGGTWGEVPATGERGRFSHYPLDRVDWVICGGESGPDARPMHPAWARSLRDQCAAARVPFLFKQWGEWAPAHDEMLLPLKKWREFPEGEAEARSVRFFGDAAWQRTQLMGRVGKKAAGRMLDGVPHDAFPEVS